MVVPRAGLALWPLVVETWFKTEIGGYQSKVIAAWGKYVPALNDVSKGSFEMELGALEHAIEFFTHLINMKDHPIYMCLGPLCSELYAYGNRKLNRAELFQRIF